MNGHCDIDICFELWINIHLTFEFFWFDIWWSIGAVGAILKPVVFYYIYLRILFIVFTIIENQFLRYLKRNLIWQATIKTKLTSVFCFTHGVRFEAVGLKNITFLCSMEISISRCVICFLCFSGFVLMWDSGVTTSYDN